MSRGDNLARQLQLISVLERRQEIAVSEVAHELGYTPRTLYRDLLVLERVGVPIYQERRGRRVRWRVVEGYRRGLSITLSFSELLSLELARRSSPSAAATESAMAKVAQAVPREIADRARRLAPALSATPAAQPAALELVAACIERSETVLLQYRTPGQPVVERRVDPYLLHLHAGAVYVLGFCHLRGAVRTFHASRIVSAEATAAHYAARAHFQPSALIHGALGPWEGPLQRVRLTFEAEAAPRVLEQPIHPSQTVQCRSDGAVDVELRVPVCPPLLTWLLGWGSQVRVRSPSALASRLARQHEAAVRGRRAPKASAGAAEASARGSTRALRGRFG